MGERRGDGLSQEFEIAIRGAGCEAVDTVSFRGGSHFFFGFFFVGGFEMDDAVLNCLPKVSFPLLLSICQSFLCSLTGTKEPGSRHSQ